MTTPIHEHGDSPDEMPLVEIIIEGLNVPMLSRIYVGFNLAHKVFVSWKRHIDSTEDRVAGAAIFQAKMCKVVENLWFFWVGKMRKNNAMYPRWPIALAWHYCGHPSNVEIIRKFQTKLACFLRQAYGDEGIVLEHLDIQKIWEGLIQKDGQAHGTSVQRQLEFAVTFSEPKTEHKLLYVLADEYLREFSSETESNDYPNDWGLSEPEIGYLEYLARYENDSEDLSEDEDGVEDLSGDECISEYGDGTVDLSGDEDDPDHEEYNIALKMCSMVNFLHHAKELCSHSEGEHCTETFCSVARLANWRMRGTIQ